MANCGFDEALQNGRIHLLLVAAFSSWVVSAEAGCDQNKVRELLAWAHDMRDYVELWHDRDSFGVALDELDLLQPVLDEAVQELAECPSTPAIIEWRYNVRQLQSWAVRARLAMNRPPTVQGPVGEGR